MHPAGTPKDSYSVTPGAEDPALPPPHPPHMHTTTTLSDARNTLMLKVFAANMYAVRQLLVCRRVVEVDSVQLQREVPDHPNRGPGALGIPATHHPPVPAPVLASTAGPPPRASETQVPHDSY